MTVLRAVILLVLTTTTTVVFAGKDHGGGNAVACFIDENSWENVKAAHSAGGEVSNEDIENITFLEMIDLVEAKFEQFNVATGEVELPQLLLFGDKGIDNLNNYFDIIESRFEKFFPGITDLVKEGRQKLLPNTKFRPVFQVNDINIKGPIGEYLKITFPNKCKFVAYVTIGFQEGNELLVDPRLYNHPNHSDSSRGVFYLHEFAYFRKLEVFEKALENAKIWREAYRVPEVSLIDHIRQKIH